LRLLKRKTVRPRLELKLRSVRPSLGDMRFTADPWVVDQGDGTLALRLGDYNLTQFTALALDLPSLNHLVDRVWHRRPRHRS
jgi:hypothetical protein